MKQNLDGSKKSQLLPLKLLFIAVVSIMFVAGCCSAPSQPPANLSALPPIRFLLTFDDGPSPDSNDNSTAKIADTLAYNVTQPKIKAVFFVQTRWPGAGGSPRGRELMQRLAAEGHVLGLHSGSVRGHISHIRMTDEELATSLLDGSSDIAAISGDALDLVRPPFWEFNGDTLAIYHRAGLNMLLTDVSARDGSAVLFQVDPKHGGRIHCDLLCVRKRLAEGAIPTVNGVAPVIMTFHDPNRYTAKHLPDYLAILVRTARKAELKLANPPFYTDRTELRQAARARAQTSLMSSKSKLLRCDQ